MHLHRTIIPSPLGPMVALASDEGLCALEFNGPMRGATSTPYSRHERLDARLRHWFPPHEIDERETPILKRTREWLAAYFNGERAEAAGVPLDLRGAAFERRVWQELREIPAGATSTYGAIARRLGDAGASRAVGAANGANPVGIIVPCHRVIGSSGKLVGYGGGIDRKEWLLNHEARWRAQGSLF